MMFRPVALLVALMTMHLGLAVMGDSPHFGQDLEHAARLGKLSSVCVEIGLALNQGRPPMSLASRAIGTGLCTRPSGLGGDHPRKALHWFAGAWALSVPKHCQWGPRRQTAEGMT